MKLRCRDGDVAIIIRDDPDLQANVGRFVWVYGPWREHPDLGPAWGIAAARVEPLATSEGSISIGTLQLYPDAWLQSVRCRRVRSLRPVRSVSLPQFTRANIERIMGWRKR
jgi:hypothetical protein